MITYDRLAIRPRAFASLTGLSPAQFETLFAQFEQALTKQRQSPLTRKDKQPRKRAPGAGTPYALDPRTRLLMALVWLRIYPTFEVLAVFFSLHRSNVCDNVHEVLALLETYTVFVCERPAQERKKLRSVQAVMDAFPDVRLIIDAKEQRVRRPSGNDPQGQSRQKLFYSGKKKAHTLKTQIAVSPEGSIQAVSGSIQAVSGSVAGAVHDLTLLRQSALLHRLAPDEAALLDRGYLGVSQDFPTRTCYVPFKARRGHPLTEQQKAYNRHLSRYRIVVEHTLAQMGQFQVLSQVFRHAHQCHSGAVRVVADLINRRVAHRPLKTYSPSVLVV